MIVWYSLTIVMYIVMYIPRSRYLTGQLGWLVAKRAKSTLHVCFLRGFKSLSKTRWYLPGEPDRRQMFRNHEIVCSGSCGTCARIQFSYRDTSERLVLLHMYLASQAPDITSAKYSASHVLAVAVISVAEVESCTFQHPSRASFPRT